MIYLLSMDRKFHKIQQITIIITGMITKAVHKSSEEEKKEEEVKKTLEQHDNIVTQYKELIRDQVRTAQCLYYFQPCMLTCCCAYDVYLLFSHLFVFHCAILRMLRSRS